MKIYTPSTSHLLLNPRASKQDHHVIHTEKYNDGELRFQIPDIPRNTSVTLYHSTFRPIHTNIIFLQMLLDELHHRGCTVDLVIPYFGYGRQDAIRVKSIINSFDRDNLKNVRILDPHQSKVCDYFKAPCQVIPAASIFAGEVANMDQSDLVIIPPDAGALERAQELASLTNLPVFSLEKSRDAYNVVSYKPVEKVPFKRAIILDDMIDSGQTILKAAKVLNDAGVQEIHAMVTHGLFSQNPPQALFDGPLSSLTTTNSIPCNAEHPKLKVISLDI